MRRIASPKEAADLALLIASPRSFDRAHLPTRICPTGICPPGFESQHVITYALAMTNTHPNEPALYALFDELSITYRTEEHRAVFTVAEGADVKAKLPGGHTKNLFLKDKSGAFLLISALGSTEIRLNQLHKRLGTKRLSFGKADALLEHLGVVPGSVTVFSVLNDTKGKVRLVLDKALFDHEAVWFHPMRNTASTRIAPNDILRFAEATGHEPTLIDLNEVDFTEGAS